VSTTAGESRAGRAVKRLIRKRRERHREALRDGAVRARKFTYVFVVTYGRSGSTLTQGLLNTLPRTLVRGENNLYVLSMFRAERLAKTFKKQHSKHGAGSISSAFYGLREMRMAEFARTTGELVTSQLLGGADPREVDAIGFKEVLWHSVTAEETDAFFSFMDDAFPGARYVLNQRDHEQVVGSGFWQKFDQDEVMRAILRVEEIQEFLRKTRADQTYDTRYERVTSPDQAVADAELRGLAEFITGSCDEVLLEQLRDVLKVGHGPNPFGKSRGRRSAS